MYLPLKYMVTAKYPRFFALDQTLFVDMLMPIVATSYDTKTLILHAICIPLYVLSFMCIYEIGYFENDMKAAKSEAVPVLTDQARRFGDYRLEPHAWICAIALATISGLIAARLNSLSMQNVWTHLILWSGLLIVSRAVFYIYNKQSVNNRPLLYFVLQLLKYGGILVIFRPTLFGAVITASQIITISLVYWMYRISGRRAVINREAVRLALAFGLWVPLGLGGARTDIDTAMAATLVISWAVLRLSKPWVMTTLRNRAPGGAT